MPTDIREKYAAMMAKVKKQQEKLEAEMQKAFPKITKEIFKAFPDLESFAWHQYTPYWNDGDECVFGVYVDVWGGRNGDPKYVDGIDINGKNFEEMDNEQADKWRPAAVACAELITSFDPDLLKGMFGDHVEITVHRDGRCVKESYSHD